MCEYCEKPNLKPRYKSLADNVEHDSVLSIMPFKSKRSEMIVSFLHDKPPYEGGTANIYFEIDYCPLCGRKLNSQN